MENGVKKMNLQLWDGHLSEESSEWFAENIKGLDQNIKKMLSLLGQDGDMSVQKPELISHIKEISHTHHLLADHYNKLTGAFRSFIQADTEFQNHKENNPSFQTPDKKMGMQNVENQVNSSDISLSSGGGISDSNEYSGSSSLSSDSDSESCYMSPGQFLGSVSSGKMQKCNKIADLETDIKKTEDFEILLERISKYEEELKVSNQKLMFAGEEIARLKSQLEKNDADIVKMGSLESQLVSAENKLKLHEADIEMENRKSLALQRQIVDMESKFLSAKNRVSELQESIGKYAADLSDRELELQKLSSELEDASGNFALEKFQLESCISKLSESLTFHEATREELQTKCESLANQIKILEGLKVEMEREQKALKISWEEDIKRMKAEIQEKNVVVGNLNENLDVLKLKYDMLVAEKDDVYAKLQTLNANLSARNDQIQLLESNLHEIHSQNEELHGESENAKKLASDLKSRIEELEAELGRQRIMISERAEEKREAIRQLCFSIDHFRGAYEELRNAYVVRKRPVAVVSQI